MTQKSMPLLNHKWTGPVCFGIAMLMLGTQVYAYFSVGLISAWLLGGGVGLLLLGGIASFHYLDDKRSGSSSDSGDFPTTEEFEAGLETKPDEIAKYSPPRD